MPPDMQEAQSGMMNMQRPPMPPRETNRQIIERMRAIKNRIDEIEGSNMQGDIRMNGGAQQNGEIRFEQHLDSIDGTTTGEIHIYRAENGHMIEDRVIQMPQHMPTGQPGRPIFFRASSTVGTGSPRMMVRGVVASSVRAVPIRVMGTSGLPWMENFSIFGKSAGRVIATNTPDGNVMFSFEQKRPPVREFMDNIFGLFKKMAPRFNQQRAEQMNIQFDPQDQTTIDQQFDLQVDQSSAQ
jgi:hypothetical protein